CRSRGPPARRSTCGGCRASAARSTPGRRRTCTCCRG
ncbi:MAG: Trans-aconitate 2-methyltransferase, partial [uncultured Nocardioidaceae bacterium]